MVHLTCYLVIFSTLNNKTDTVYELNTYFYEINIKIMNY